MRAFVDAAGGGEDDIVEVQHLWARYEPMDWRLDHASALSAVLGAIACLREGKRVKPEDWQGMGFRYGAGLSEWLTESYGWQPLIDVDRRLVAGRVNYFLRGYGIGLRLSDRFTVEVEPGEVAHRSATMRGIRSRRTGGRQPLRPAG